jgi:thioredoxin 1
MKKILISILILGSVILSNCKAENPENGNKDTKAGAGVVQLSTESFKKLVYNFDVNKDWKYEGNLPAIIDFYADWCPPCRQLSPIVEEIAKEYQGKIVVYRVNTDKEKRLTESLGITNLPTLLYVPANGRPQATLGSIPKETIIKTINKVLLTR